MKCPKCGREILETDTNCQYCGVNIAYVSAYKESAIQQQATLKAAVREEHRRQAALHYDNVYANLALIFALFGSSVIGFILGIIGLSRANQYYDNGRGKSIAAIIISIIGTIALFIVLKNSIIDLGYALLKLYSR